MKRKMVSALLCATMVAGMVVVPAATAQAADKKVIGVTMPTKDLQRWNQDGENMKKELEEGSLKLEDLKACIARLVSVIWKSNQYEESK